MRPSSASVIARNSPPFINARSFSSAAARAPSSSTKLAARSRDLLRRFWNSAAGFWGQYGTSVSWFLSAGSPDAADEGACRVQSRCNEFAAQGRPGASDVKGALVYLLVGLLRAAEQRYELAAFHSITSSARASSVGGTVRASALAVLRLMINSKRVGCSTGKSPGFVPFKIFPTYDAERLHRSARLVP